MIKAAIIDDGANPERFNIHRNIVIDDDLVITEKNAYDNTELSHADICMSIIELYACMDNVKWYNIKVLKDDTKRGYVGRLLKALEFCEAHGIKLIHMSIGTTDYRDFRPIESIVMKLLNKEVVIVSATSNEGVVTYPAYLPGVIGVKSNFRLKNDEYFYRVNPIERINFHASSFHKINIDGQMVDSAICNSYSTPLITAKAIAFLVDNPKLNCSEVADLLIKDAKMNQKQEFLADSADNELEGNNYYLLSSINAYNDNDIEIPIVILNGFCQKQLLCVMCELAECFKEADYNFRIALDHPSAVDLNMIPINTEVNIEDYVRKMNAYFQCEIILLGFSEFVQPERCPSASLWIWDGTETEHEANRFNLPSDQLGIYANDETGKELYKRIVSILE